MSRPACSWSLITTRVASWNASACEAILNASSTSRPASCWVNHSGRGYEPTIVVGRSCMARSYHAPPGSRVLQREDARECRGAAGEVERSLDLAHRADPERQHDQELADPFGRDVRADR